MQAEDAGMEFAREVKGERQGVRGMFRAVNTDREVVKHGARSPQSLRLRSTGGAQEGKLSQAKGTRTLELVAELEELAQRCGIEVRHEKLLREIGYRARSGSCKVKEKNLVILDRTLAPAEQVEVLADVLRGQDLESRYLSPAARRLLQEDRG
jgi:hypothetical protein